MNLPNVMLPSRRLLAALLLFTALSSRAQQTKPDLNKLDAYFAQALKDWNVPGMAIAIVKNDSVVFAKGYGVRDIEKGGVVDANTSFAVASNTKPFTAAALATLADEGKLKWTDPVIKHIPYFQLYDPFVTANTTVRDLLSHRVGLTTFSGDLVWYKTSYSREDIIKRARHLKPSFGFRDGFGYSNIMFLAAGEIIPAITGQSWDNYIKEKFLKPLGMNNTVLSIKDFPAGGNIATPHALNEKDQNITVPYSNWDNIAPAGSINSSVNDMAQWLRLQLGKGTFEGKKIFSEASSRAMLQAYSALPVSAGYEKMFPSTHFRGVGLSWFLFDYHGRKVANHSGGYDGMVSMTALVPEEKLGIVVLTNSMTGIYQAMVYQILDAYLAPQTSSDWSKTYLDLQKKQKDAEATASKEAARKKLKKSKPTHDLKDYTGKYSGALYGDAEVTLEKGKLVVNLLPSPDFTMELEPWQHDIFQLQFKKVNPFFSKGTVQFLMDNKGEITEMVIDAPNPDFDFTELKFYKVK